MTRLLSKLGLILVGCLLLVAPAYASFPGANGKIISTIFLGDGYSEFNVMNPDGTGLTRLTDFCCQNTDPAWSADGSKVAFDRNYNVAVMNADATGLTTLTNNGTNVGPTWSPDGTKIAFSRSDPIGDPNNPSSGPLNIVVMNADGTGLTRLTNNDRLTFDQSPAWSPDGTKIAFARGQIPAGPTNIYVMNADGTGVTRLTNVTRPDPFNVADNPNWSPDGSKIVFVSPDRYDQIWTMNADGTGVTQLTSYSGGPTVSWGDPHWAPDGSKIAFVGSSGIFTMNPDGSGQTFLGGGGGIDWQPLPASEFKNRAKKCKAEGKRGRALGKCVSGR